MTACPACQHELDDAARTAGRCPACGAALRAVAHRTIADVRGVQEPKVQTPPTPTPPAEEPDAGGKTIDISSMGTAGSIDIQIMSTLPEVGGEGTEDAGAASSSSKTLS